MQRLLSLIDLSGLSDTELEILFGVRQSTVWRLKNGKIRKIDRYVDTLIALPQFSGPVTEERVISDLLTFSQHSNGVRDILHSLHELMRERA